MHCYEMQLSALQYSFTKVSHDYFHFFYSQIRFYLNLTCFIANLGGLFFMLNFSFVLTTRSCTVFIELIWPPPWCLIPRNEKSENWIFAILMMLVIHYYYKKKVNKLDLTPILTHQKPDRLPLKNYYGFFFPNPDHCIIEYDQFCPIKR